MISTVGRTLPCAALIALSLILAGCTVNVPSPDVASTNSPSEAEQARIDRENHEQNVEEENDRLACIGFRDDMVKYQKQTKSRSTAAFVKGYTALAFSVGNRAVKAGEDSDVQEKLYELSSVAAANADEIAATETLSTARSLDFQVALNVVADECALPEYDFD